MRFTARHSSTSRFSRRHLFGLALGVTLAGCAGSPPPRPAEPIAPSSTAVGGATTPSAPAASSGPASAAPAVAPTRTSGGGSGGILFTDGQHLWVADPAANPRSSGAQREVFDSRGKGTVTDPAWSPDRSQIVFSYTPVTQSGDFGSDLHSIPAAGGTPTVLFTHDVDGGLARAPVWSPDGGSIYFSYSFTASKPGQTLGETVQRIERLDLKANARSVVANEADLPAITPDGSQLAFLRIPLETTEPPSLWLANADGTSARQLVAGTAFKALWSPRFAPDGRTLLFTANGGNRTKPRLTIKTPQPVGLSWPPSVAAHGLPMDFWLIDVSSGQLELLAALGADDLFGAWAPDGKRLAYITLEGLFLLDLTSGSLTMVNPTPAFGSLDWSR